MWRVGNAWLRVLALAPTCLMPGAMSHAAGLRLYDNARLVVLEDRGKLQGYYTGSSDTSYLAADRRAVVRCSFLFRQTGRDDEAVELLAWEPSLVMPGEDRMTTGALRESRGHAVLQFQDVPNGCRSKPDGDGFLIRPTDSAMPGTAIEDQGLHARRVGQESAIGIRIVPGGATIEHAPSSVTVPKWALVVLVKQQAGKSFVRYVDPSTGQATEGWIASALKNPFGASRQDVRAVTGAPVVH